MVTLENARRVIAAAEQKAVDIGQPENIKSHGCSRRRPEGP